MKPDGGPAFPVSTHLDDSGRLGHQDGPTSFQFAGMTLRDYFAAAALQGICSNFPEAADAVGSRHGVAEDAYLIADAMLAEREKP